MDQSELEDIEQVLGHRIGPDSGRRIRDLYDVPPNLIADARKLGSLTLSNRLLRHCTTESLWPWLPAFIDDVVDRGIDPKVWLRGGILYPLFPLETLVTLDVGGILSVLDPAKDEVWLQVAPEREAWGIGETVTGAPAVARPELRYDSETSDQVRRVLLNGSENLLTVEDILVATRRWIASQIAGRVAKLDQEERFDDARSLLTTVLPQAEHISDDALIATSGVLREIREMRQNKVDMPGFRGPSEWYRAS